MRTLPEVEPFFLVAAVAADPDIDIPGITVAEADGVDEAASAGVVGEGAALDEAAGTTATASGTRTMAMTENTAASGWMVTSLDAGVGSAHGPGPWAGRRGR